MPTPRLTNCATPVRVFPFPKSRDDCLLPLVECTTGNTYCRTGTVTTNPSYITGALFYLSAGDCSDRLR